MLLFGAYALIDGVLSIVAAVTNEPGRGRWWALILQGVCGIIAAGVTVVFPGLAALALLYVIAAWALVTGAFEVAAAIRLRKYLNKEWLLALVLWIGAYMFVAGCLLVVLGLKLRTWGRSQEAALRVA